MHEGLKGIGLDASVLSIDTDNSNNSENVSVLYTVIHVPELESYFHLNTPGDMCSLLAVVILGANWCWYTDPDKEAHQHPQIC